MLNSKTMIDDRMMATMMIMLIMIMIVTIFKELAIMVSIEWWFLLSWT